MRLTCTNFENICFIIKEAIVDVLVSLARLVRTFIIYGRSGSNPDHHNKKTKEAILDNVLKKTSITMGILET